MFETDGRSRGTAGGSQIRHIQAEATGWMLSVSDSLLRVLDLYLFPDQRTRECTCTASRATEHVSARLC